MSLHKHKFLFLILFTTLVLLFLVLRHSGTRGDPQPLSPPISQAATETPKPERPPVHQSEHDTLLPKEKQAPPAAKIPNPDPAADSPTPLLAREGGTLGTQIPPLPRGHATINLEAGTRSPRNFEGHYQRVHMPREAPAEITLHWPGAGSRQIVVHPIHGGTVNGKPGAQILQTDPRGHLNFRFESAGNTGRYEILLRSGPSEEVLHFGSPPDTRKSIYTASETGSAPTTPPSMKDLSRFTLAFLLIALANPARAESCGNNSNPSTPPNPCGNSGGANLFNPFTGNVSREITDLELHASIGERPLRFTRLSTSRYLGGLPTPLGPSGNWRHNYLWKIRFLGSDAAGEPRIAVDYPDGSGWEFQFAEPGPRFMTATARTHDRHSCPFVVPSMFNLQCSMFNVQCPHPCHLCYS